MIKILEKGKINEVKVLRCDDCKTKFTYQNSDVKSDRDGSYVACPGCGGFIADSLGKPYRKE